ncbi:type II CRISPR RNA-guided endonuclease Cas9 [Hoylesella nanceiensis]|jgi:putative uncharacterized protein (fragment)|uniref:type II CRISPR RNA-guided endonuclease Cas9 n=1 Tax=Hoylesella nanceiensis TaxID=425941 RepID=UPI0027BB0517|nr:type II CRISPR RNA-guided endonuclease Cas9 [Hoylesella nanceiensis]
MTQKIFGIDLGTNSIGTSVRNTDLGNNLVDQLEFFSSDIFKASVNREGVNGGKGREYSLASSRSAKRRKRRLYEHRRYKLWATLDLLIKNNLCPMTPESLEQWRTYDKKKKLFRQYPIEDKAFHSWIILDFNSDGKPDYSSPYQLRRELVSVQLDFNQAIDRYKLGRALYHIAQHRGFKSSKGETIAEQEKQEDDSKKNKNNALIEEHVDATKASEEKHSKGLSTYMQEHNLKTVGAAFAQLEDEGIRIRNNSEYKAIRSQHQDEIKEIFKFQKGLSSQTQLLDTLISEKQGIGTIFYKRPLCSQRGNVGKCTLEPNKPRCPIGHPLFEKFRAWTFINNIKAKSPDADSAEPLPMDMRINIYNKLFLSRVKADFKFEEIRNFIEKQWRVALSKDDKTINYRDDTSVAGCPITARMIKVLGEDWEKFQVLGTKERQTQGKSNNALHQVCYTAEDIWHFCYDAEDSGKVRTFAEETLGWDEKKAAELVRLWSAIPQGYAMLSQKAIRNINRMLLFGLKYSDAVLLAKLPDILELSDEDIQTIIKKAQQLEEVVNEEKRIGNIVNSLIANYKAESLEDRFADHNYEYQLDESDEREIIKHIENNIGKQRWELMDADEQISILEGVRSGYQAFFARHKRTFVELPQLGKRLVELLSKEYPSVTEKQWERLYHPSQIAIYRPILLDKSDEKRRLGNPDIGAIKNPTVMRTLNNLRRRVNQLLDDGVLMPDETRVVVETARDLNNANEKWALEKYQEIRRKENDKIKKILEEFYPQFSNITSTDVDKARYVIEQCEEDNYTSKKESGTYSKNIQKYKYWLEQGGQCLYTGRIISLSNLFDSNAFDLEHTIPASVSFDNSDQNMTLCEAHYNRFIKKNNIPTAMPNYEEDVTIDGKLYTAIKPRLEKWKKRIKRLSKNVEYWRTQARRTQMKDHKDECTKEKLLWQMELQYWRDKLQRFTILEVTDGFKNSQLVDTRIITRHAILYLKSVFKKVEVQRGSTTAEFRKILGVQSVEEKKDRTLHSHHAIDATILTTIPTAGKRERILELFYKVQEKERRLKNCSGDAYEGLKQDLEGLQAKLKKEVVDCKLGGEISQLGNFINDKIIINHCVKDQTLTPSHKRLRRRGRIVGGKEHPIWQTGDTLRGEIHAESYYGAITQYAKDKEGNVLFNNGKPKIDPTLWYVIRRKPTYFNDWKPLEKDIVDKNLFKLMKEQFPDGTSFEDACKQGFYMIKKGKDKKHNIKTHRIRHVRCYAVKTALKIKEQIYKSTKDYKQYFYAAVGDLYTMCCYTNGKNKEYRIYSLYDIAQHRKSGIEDIPEFITDEKGNRLELSYKLRKGDMVLLYEKTPEELYDMDPVNLKRRLYKVNSFENDGLRIIMTNHMVTNKEKGESIKAYSQIPQTVRCAVNTLKFLIMGDHNDFIIKSNNIIFNHR